MVHVNLPLFYYRYYTDILLTGVSNIEWVLVIYSVFVDTMGLVNLIIKVSNPLQTMWKRSDSYTKSYRHVDIIVDKYPNSSSSIKLIERLKGSELEHIQIVLPQSKVPSDFQCTFLCNSSNKARLVDLLFDYIRQEKLKC